MTESPAELPDPAARREQIAAGLQQTQQRIAAACAAADRDPGEVTLIVVTKTRPASDVAILAELGVTDVGENREPEASRKHAECDELPLTWHFIGQLQRNKAGKVARYANMVHSLDRPEIVAALDGAAERAERTISALVQVDLSGGAEGRGGVAPEQLLSLCQQVADSEQLRLAGIMAVAPLQEDPAAAFDRLVQLRESVLVDFPTAQLLSAGMSGDLEQAVQAGATHVRVGSAVLGERHYVR